MDINSASEEQLKTLPGLTDEQIRKIFAGRPYTGKDQLLKQNIVDKDEYRQDSPAHPRQAAKGQRQGRQARRRQPLRHHAEEVIHREPQRPRRILPSLVSVAPCDPPC
jgi:hypothetical protein